MSKASKWAEAQRLQPDSLMHSEFTTSPIASVSPEGKLEIPRNLLSQEDALRLRDWLTDVFDEPKAESGGRDG